MGRFCFRAFGRLEISGAEGVPQFGPLSVVSNHLSLNDPPLLVAAIPRPLFFIGKKELFDNAFFRFLMTAFHVSPFDRSAAGIDAVRVLMQNLERDRAVVIFPEGTRSPDHAMQKGMLGVVYLAMKSQAPILPVGVTGTHKFPLWRVPFPFKRLKANMVMGRIADLLPPEHRGVYGGDKVK